MMPAHGSEAPTRTRLRATPIGQSDFDGLAFFLAGARLPTADLKEPGRLFYRVNAGDFIGYAGIEGSGPDRLLRSLVVLPDRHRVGSGRVVLGLIEHEGASMGVERLHLLTTTAAHFFRAQGYVDAARATAPATIAATAEFTEQCPASAAYLVKHLKDAS